MHVLIIHYQTNGTDGVSLEIKKRIKVLHKLGHEVRVLDNLTFPFLDLGNTPFINFLNKSSYSHLTTGRALQRIEAEAGVAFKSFLDYFNKYGPDIIYVHNLFSLPIIPAASLGLYRAIKHMRLPVLAYNHDFWQTRDYFPQEFKSLLRKFPIKSTLLYHITINSLDTKYLEQVGIKDYLVRHDYWDDASVSRQDKVKEQILLKRLQRKLRYKPNIIFLVATRIIPRKGIENAIRFIAVYNKMYAQQGVLVLSNPEHKDKEYFDKLRRLAADLNVYIYEVSHKSDFWYWYYLADVLLYPTYLEGFGNQFLEAMYFEKPLVMFEYDVFKSDISPKGFKVISLGDKLYRDEKYNLMFVPHRVLEKAAKELHNFTSLGVMHQIYKRNKRLLTKHYSISVLERDIKEELEFAGK